MLVLVCASTAVRASEACGLKWSDINWDENQIMIERRWTAARLDKPKTKASKAPVPMSPALASFLHQWRKVTQYGGNDDWIFPSYKLSGAIPMCAGIFVTDHLRPAALSAGINITDRQRFGLHSLRSSMATWMVSIDKTDVKTAQGNMRHAEIMLSKYCSGNHGRNARCSGAVVRKLWVGCGSESLFRKFWGRCNPMTLKGLMVSAAGLEPATHALKGHCSTN
jgi:integrase